SFFRTLAGILIVLGLAGAGQAQTTYTWNDSTTDWTAASAWTASGPDWTSTTRLVDSIAAFAAQGAIVNQPTIGANNLNANAVTIDNSGGAAWNITGTTGVLTLGFGGVNVSGGGTSTITANIGIFTNQTWTVGTSTTLQMGGTSNAGILSGAGTITKAGAGTPLLYHTKTFPGPFALTGRPPQVRAP